MRPVLYAAIALVCPQPALAAFAIIPPADLTAMAETAAAKATIARAAAALGRPPGAIPKLHTEGTLPGHGIRDISLVAKRDQPILLDLAFAWALTRDRRFLDQTARYVKAWADIYQMSFNPIDETGFDTLAIANDLTAADLPPETARALDEFWRRMAVGYLDAMDGKPKNAITNWQSHRIKLATLAAYRTGDAALVTRARGAFQRQIAANLRADGSTFDFEERDALHYVTYNLDPLMMAALAAKAHGEDWFGWRAPSGAGLPISLDWLGGFATGEKTHIEFARSRIAFDRERAAAGQKDYAPHAWNPANAVNSFALASLLDPRFVTLRDDLARRTGRAPADWTVLIAR
jgi:hypothetical protein